MNPRTIAIVATLLLVIGCSEASSTESAQVGSSAPKGVSAPSTPTATPVPRTPTPTATSVPRTPTPVPSRNSEPTTNHRDEGRKFIDNGQFEKAVGSFSKHIESNPRDVDSYVYRAHSYSELYKYQAAFDDLIIALGLPIALSTDFGSVDSQKMILTVTGALAFELGFFRDAIKYLDRSLSVETTNTASEEDRYSETQWSIQWLIDGYGYLGAGLYAKAVESFTEFIDCSWNGHPGPWQPPSPDGCEVYHHNMFLDVTKTERSGTHPIGFLQRGIAYRELGKSQDAIADFEKAIQLDPNNDRGYAQRASDEMTK